MSKVFTEALTVVRRDDWGVQVFPNCHQHPAVKLKGKMSMGNTPCDLNVKMKDMN